MCRERRSMGGETMACTGGRRVGGGASMGNSICRDNGMSVSSPTFGSGCAPYIAAGVYGGTDICCVGLPMTCG